MFKCFLCNNFRKYEHYEEMLPKSNQPGQFCGTAKRHKFINIDEITVDTSYTYTAAKVISEYLKPLWSGNNYIIRNTQEFPISLKQQDLLLTDKEYVSYDIESLFLNVPVHETIDYILQEIMSKKNYRYVPN